MKNIRIHRFKINERDREAGKKPVHYMRRFWTFYRMPEEKDLGGGYLETIVRPENRSSVCLHFGNAGSENPFKAHLIIFGCGFYFGLDNNLVRRFAHRLTTSKKEKYSGRDISLRLGDGHLWWRLWSTPHSSSSDTPRWRDGNIMLNPADHIWGTKAYFYEDLATANVELELPEASYPVKLTLQKVTHRRRKSKRVLESSYSVDVDAAKGVPSHYDKSGGWKGDRTYGWGINLPSVNFNDIGGWMIDAKAGAESWVLKERARTGFRTPQDRD